jgi:hypothetical protein
MTEDRAVESAKFSWQSIFTGPPAQIGEPAIGQLLARAPAPRPSQLQKGLCLG